ncbi:hypothetical protein FN846DRAFT_631478 [Sphaerosporella brunnea]|uniref:Transmembrane protein n=1 Tax=Sphaerosporella brunnea TaxID=1250544 RepID=A0A5J5ECC8_9PEZI|nr:hypothetical protein FN846DRAFT_631478 [Sphaerosporella brunnea]
MVAVVRGYLVFSIWISGYCLMFLRRLHEETYCLGPSVGDGGGNCGRSSGRGVYRRLPLVFLKRPHLFSGFDLLCISVASVVSCLFCLFFVSIPTSLFLSLPLLRPILIPEGWRQEGCRGIFFRFCYGDARSAVSLFAF